MLTLLGANLVPLFIAFVIGVITGWWAWAHYRADARLDTVVPQVPSVAASIPAAPVAAAAIPVAVAAVPKAKAPTKPKVAAKPKAAAPVKLVSAPVAKTKAAPKAKAPARVAVKAAPVANPKPVAKPKAAAKPEAVTVAKAAPKPKAPPKPKLPDDLLQLKGVGPKLNTLLNSLGVHRFDQIAKWKAKDVSAIDAQMGTFRGRIERENWIEQASLLAKGKIAEFEAKYGTLDSENR